MNSFSWIRKWKTADVFCIGFIQALFATMAAGSWRAWGDPVIDFPAQLYMAWRISAGDQLYKNLQHFYGPFSQLLNGAVFSIFGSNYLVLVLFNLSIISLISLGLYLFLSRTWGTVTGILASIAFLAIHAFQQLGATSSFNFVAPYSHEATHGVVLLLASILLATHTQRFSKGYVWMATGILFGLALMTKPEFTLACLLITAVNLVIEFTPYNYKACLNLLRPLRIFLLGAVVAPTLIFLYFLLVYKWSRLHALQGTFGAFYPLISTDIAANPIYKYILGTADLSANVLATLKALGLVFICFVPAFGIDRVAIFSKYRSAPWVYCLMLAVGLNLSVNLFVARAWPILSILGLIAVVFMYRRGRLSSIQFKSALFFGIAAVILISKVFFKASFTWFGFYLTLPATLFLIIVGTAVLPLLSKTLRWATVILFCSLSFQAARYSLEAYKMKDLAIGDGSDRFFVLSKAYFTVSGPFMKEVVERVRTRTSSTSTLLALPEGTLVNYLLRIRNPTPYVSNFVAKTLYDAWGGAGAILQQLAQTPPEFVMYLNRHPEIPSPVYWMRGPDGFANQVLDSIDLQYVEIDRLGPQTQDFSKLGYVLLKRKSP